MTIDFAGTEMEAFIPSGPTNTENTTAGSFDSTVVRCGVAAGTAVGQWIETPNTTPRDESWTHFEVYFSANWSNSGNTLLYFYNAGGTALFRLQFTSGMTLQGQYWNGSTWVNIGGTVAVNVNRFVFDVHIKGGSSGSFALYNNGVLATSGAADLSTVTGIAKRRWFHTNSNGVTVVSQVIVSNLPTVGHRFYSKPPTGNGANTAWTSDFTAVDELTLSTADFIESTVAGDIETFTGAAISIPTGVVKAVVVSGQLKNSVGGPQNAQGVIRKAGTNYFSGNIPGIGVGYGPAQAIFEVDPATSTTWTLADAGAASLEFGFRSQA